MRVQGKKILITGGTSGIGLAAACRLAGEGGYIGVVGRAGDRLRCAAELLGGQGEAFAADVAAPGSLLELMATVRARLGRIDVLVINAGVSDAPDIEALDPAAYDALMDVNCKGAVFTFVHALPLLSDGASVIFTGSVAGRKGQPSDALYAGSKGFVRAFARSAGTDPNLLKRNIRVNVVTPGPIDTPLTEAAVLNPEANAYVEGLVPMGRWGRTEEVAEAILFLASDESSFTTGAEITVDGGLAHV